LPTNIYEPNCSEENNCVVVDNLESTAAAFVPIAKHYAIQAVGLHMIHNKNIIYSDFEYFEIPEKIENISCGIPVEEFEALMDLRQILNKESFYDRSWKIDLSKQTCGIGGTNGWRGVRLGSEHVNFLELRFDALIGSIPSSIGNFTELKQLRLDHNPQLTGRIPKEIGNLKNLEVLDLRGCNLSGQIPDEILNLKKINNNASNLILRGN